MELRKRIWMFFHGYRRLTNRVIYKYMAQAEYPHFKGFEGIKSTFKYYRRFGDVIVPYSETYLSQKTLGEIKMYHYHWIDIAQKERLMSNG